MEATLPEIKWLETRTSRWDELVEIASTSQTHRVTPDTALRTSAVLACVRVLSETVAALPLVLYRRLPDGEKIKATENPLYRLLHQRPNSWQTRFEYVEQQMLHLTLYGNHYALKVPGERGPVSQLWALHPAGMEVKQDETTKEITYKYREPGTSRQIIYREDQIMHTRWLCVNGPVGSVPIELGKDAISLARSLEQHAARFFQNNATPGLILHTDQALPREVREQLREQWEQTHRGPQRAGKTAILSNGLKAETISQSLEASQFAELRTQAVLEIARIYKVQPHKIQELGRATWGNLESEQISFVQDTILPWLRRIEGAIERDLLPDDGDELFAEFMVEGLLRGDTMTRYNAYQIGLQNGWLTVPEVRKKENLPPLLEPQQPVEPVATASADSSADQQRQPRHLLRFDPDQPRDDSGKWSGAGGSGGGGDGGGSSYGSSGDSTGSSASSGKEQKQRKERLRDRIEGTQAEANREVQKADKKVREISQKLNEVKSRLQQLEAGAKAAAQVQQQLLDRARARTQEKIAAAKAKYEAKMQAIKQKYGRA